MMAGGGGNEDANGVVAGGGDVSGATGLARAQAGWQVEADGGVLTHHPIMVPSLMISSELSASPSTVMFSRVRQKLIVPIRRSID